MRMYDEMELRGRFGKIKAALNYSRAIKSMCDLSYKYTNKKIDRKTYLDSYESMQNYKIKAERYF